jgi:hypothetical protein
LFPRFFEIEIYSSLSHFLAVFARNGSQFHIQIGASQLFHLPVSEEAMVQLNFFQTMLQNLLPGDGYDSWFIFGSNKSYNVSQLYKNM